MNKKVIISCIIILLLIILGLFYIAGIEKADADIPSINSNLAKANSNYDEIISSLNNENYHDASKIINETLDYYNSAKYSSQRAMNKTIKENDTVQTQYLNYTICEIDLKIEAIGEIQKGIDIINPDDLSLSMNYFDKSNQLMQNSTRYTEERNNLEKQYPDKFKK
jgi:hypothetical protein